MKPIKLPVLYINDNDIELTELGVKNEEDCTPDVRNVTFYQITVISPYRLGDGKITCIHTANQDFLCPLPIDEVEKLIEKWLKY